MATYIRRREFIFILGGTAAAWPLAARAQQPAMPVVGFLSSGQPQTFAHMIDAFRQGLSQTGYVVGQNVTFEHLAAGSEYDRFRAMADDLVRRQVAVIFATGGTAAALAARTATSTIPIVFYMGGDPVQQGLVASLGRPGGNLTGFSWLGFALAAKRLELLRELLPNGATIGMLVNPTNPDSDFEVRDVQDAARILGRQIHNLTASSDSDFDGVFATLVKQQIGALIVASDAYFSGRRGGSSRWRHDMVLPRSMNGASSRMQADSSVTDTTARMLIVNLASIPAEFLRVRNPPSCLSCNQPNLNWLSTSMRRRHLASKFRRSCSRLPTR
jgi:ABC-type uncharacterized transport system substrate-binding protein